jgi:hypothetical protein
MTRASDTARILSGGAVINEDSNDVDFRVESNGNANMLVVDAGNDRVGIGEGTPDVPLHITYTKDVAFSIDNFTTDANCGLKIENTSTTGNAMSIIQFRTGSGADNFFGIEQQSANDGDFVFGNQNSTDLELMRMKANGNVLIGTTNELPGVNNTGEGMSLRGASTANSLIVSRNSGISGYFNRNDNGSVLSFRRSGTEEGNISVTTTSASFTSVSDYRLKENVTYDFDATTRLKQLKPARFNFIVEPDTTVDGFLAHEVQSVVPQAITGEKDATETYIDDDGNEQTRIKPQGIDQSKLVPLLVKTIQELEARITALENA